MINIICPKCKSKLIFKKSKVLCNNCNSIFSVISDIICFIPETDEFYEGKFGAEKQKINKFKSYIKHIYFKCSVFGNRTKHEKYYSKLKAINDNKINVLDLGCGGGNPYLKRNNDFYIVGVDLSLTSLFNAKNVYDKVYKVPVTNLPFPSNSFDCVCSFDLIGHIPFNQKNSFLKEIHRVLKPGGLLAITVDFNIPRDNCVLESNVNVANLISIDGAEIYGEGRSDLFPGEKGFNFNQLISNSDIDIANYCDTLKTSIGFVLRKKDEATSANRE